MSWAVVTLGGSPDGGVRSTLRFGAKLGDREGGLRGLRAGATGLET